MGDFFNETCDFFNDGWSGPARRAARGAGRAGRLGRAGPGRAGQGLGNKKAGNPLGKPAKL
jgi:hypothetical protein